MIKLIKVYKKFKDVVVLDNVSLSFKPGHIYGITGRNASGKSVLFKTICGFLEPDSGVVEIDNIDVYKNKCFPQNLAALIEKPKFMDDMTGLENLLYLAKIKNKINRETIIEMMNKVGISKEDQDKLYKNYSVGTKQKLGIAQVFMEDDKILILDEPFNGLDDKTVIAIRNLIASEKAKDKIILLASHMKEDIELLCDVVYRINMGRVTKIEE